MDFDLKIVYNIKAYKNRHLLRAKKFEKDFNKKRVYSILKKNRSVTTGEIQTQLEEMDNQHNERIIEEAEELYSSGKINSTEKNKIIKEETIKTIDIRTVQNIVKELYHEGLIIKQKRRIQLLRNEDFSSPYVSLEYGKTMIDKILNTDLTAAKHLVKELIDRFGMIMLFNFIIAYREIKNKNEHNVKNTYYDEIYWLESVISIEDMYNHFIKIIEQYEIQNKYEVNMPLIRKLSNIMKSDYQSIFSSLSEIKNQFTKQE